jgi:hypothetical protein
VAPGQRVSLTASVKANRAATVLVDLEVYSPNGTRVYQHAVDNAALASGAAREFATAWTVPAGSPAGLYTIKVGIFRPGWGGTLSWNNSAGSFRVGAATASPTPTPTAVAFATSANSAPTNPRTGQVVTITASVTANRATTALIDIEVYDRSGQRVFQRFFDNQSLGAGSARYLTASWTPSRAGTYTVKIGVFRPGWNGTLAWNPQAATIVVR